MKLTESHDLVAVFVILIGTGVSVKTDKLTLAGGLTGACVASIIYISGGYTALAMLGVFFIMGTLSTSWRKAEKQKHVNNHQQKRDAKQVLANAVISALAAFSICLYPDHTRLLQLMIAASLASAAADTLSSELGMIYGRRFYNILSLKSEAQGLDGAVSVEGTLIGIAGSTIIALIYAIGYDQIGYFSIVIIAGTAGNIIDSVLGAALERKNLLTNNLVNFLNTAAAALIAGVLACCFNFP